MTAHSNGLLGGATVVQRALLEYVGRGLAAVVRRSGGTGAQSVTHPPQQGGLVPTDWTALIDAAQLHGVHGLLHEAVRNQPQIPAPAAQAIDALHRQELQRSIRLSTELLRLLTLFEEHGIPAMPIKGPVLAQRVYGNLGLRAFWDLDLLVPQDAVAEAGQLLAQEGFVAEERWSARRLRRELRGNCEQNFDHPERLVHVELHWRFVPRSIGLDLSVAEVWQRAEEIVFLGRPMPVPALQDELLTLTVHHGAKHGWERLRMITDVSLLVGRILDDAPGGEREGAATLIQRTEAAGIRRLLSTGILMAHRLLGAEMHPALLNWAQRDPRVSLLVTRSTARLLSFTGEVEGNGLMELSVYLRSRERWGDRMRYLPRAARTVFAPTEQEQRLLPLPRGLHGLHVVLRPPRLLMKYLKRALTARRVPE